MGQGLPPWVLESLRDRGRKGSDTVSKISASPLNGASLLPALSPDKYTHRPTHMTSCHDLTRGAV